MKNIGQLLQDTPLFKGLPPDQIQQIRRIALSRQFARGEIIFDEGQKASGFFVVVSGSVKVFKSSSEGKEQILHIFGPGEPFGEVPVFTGKPLPAYAQALTPSRLLFIPRGAFVELIEANPSLALNMIAVLAQRLRQFTVQIENLSLKEVPARLASYLLYLSNEHNQAEAVHLPISKGQLASLLGTIPETLSRILTRMAGESYIAVDGRTIRLLDRDKLTNLAEYGKI